MDKLTQQHRSWNMSRIRSTNTKPELIVRSLLHRIGFRFRLHRKDLPGKPDIVLPKLKAIIFVNGCFWHRHNCKYGKVKSKTRAEFWEKKIRDNVERDKRNKNKLKDLGWNVFVIWECETKDCSKLLLRIERFFI